METPDKIDVLRGLAVLGVFCYHATIAVFGVFYIPVNGWLMDFSDYPLKRVLLNFQPAAFGSFGVELFLIISGFLIHSGYLRNGFNPLLFFNKRFWRIYPPYLLALLFFTVTLALPGGWINLMMHLTMTYNLHNAFFFGTNPSFWSLALEVQLYLLYPVFLLMRRKLGLWAYVVILLLHLGFIAGEVWRGTTPLWLANFVLKFWAVWVSGAFLAERYHAGKRLSRLQFRHLALIAIGLLAARAVYFPVILLAFTVFLCLFMDWFLSATLPKIAAFRFIVVLGLCSYSLYLFHQPFLPQVIGFFSLHYLNTPLVLLGTALAFGLFYGVSYVTYRAIELPSIRYGKYFYNRISAKK